MRLMNTHWELLESIYVLLLLCQREGVSTEEGERKHEWCRVTEVLSGDQSPLQNAMQCRNT